jgi:hypothetical protein
LPQIAGFGMAHHRHHKTVRGLGGDADMDRIEAVDDAGLIVKMGIDLRKIRQGPHQRPHQEGQHGELVALAEIFLVEMLAQLFQRGDVDLFDIGEMGDAAFGIGHALGDLAAQPDHLDVLAALTLGEAAGRGYAARAQIGVEILLADAAGRAGPADILQLDPEFLGAAAHRRRGEDLLAGRSGGGLQGGG